MDELRKKIDAIDTRILKLLAKRLELSKRIGKLKQNSGIKIQDCEREKEILREIEKISKEHHLNPLFVKTLYLEILRESREIQSHEK